MSVFRVAVVVPRSESAAGFGPYPRTMAEKDETTLRAAKAYLNRNAITWRAALHDHETRFEAQVVDDRGHPVLFRVFGREEIHDEPWIGRAELRRLKAAHEGLDVVRVRWTGATLDGHALATVTLDVAASPQRVEARALNGAAINVRGAITK